jgi:hypothetical protein
VKIARALQQHFENKERYTKDVSDLSGSLLLKGQPHTRDDVFKCGKQNMFSHMCVLLSADVSSTTLQT